MISEVKLDFHARNTEVLISAQPCSAYCSMWCLAVVAGPSVSTDSQDAGQMQQGDTEGRRSCTDVTYTPKSTLAVSWGILLFYPRVLDDLHSNFQALPEKQTHHFQYFLPRCASQVLSIAKKKQRKNTADTGWRMAARAPRACAVGGWDASLLFGWATLQFSAMMLSVCLCLCVRFWLFSCFF